MKRILTLFASFCLFLTACGTDENSAKNISETEITESDLQNVTEPVTAESVTEPTVIETEAGTLPITTVPSEMESISADDSKTIGNKNYGYLDVSSDWKYKEPMVIEASSIEYTDGNGNSISIRLYAEWGADGQYIYSDEGIDDLAERCYEQFKEFKNIEMIETKIDGYKAYKLTYIRAVRTDDGRGEVSYGDKYYAECLFECADGINRSVMFSGDEKFTKSADKIIKTYHLYK